MSGWWKAVVKRSILVLVVSSLLAACVGQQAYWVPPAAYTPPSGGLVTLTPQGSASNVEPALVLEASPTLSSEVVAQATPTPQEDDPPPAPTPVPTEAPLIIPTPAAPTATPEVAVVDTSPVLYYAQAADTLQVVAVRFGVQPSEIASAEPLPGSGFIHPGQLLIIPRRLGNTTSSKQLLPDSEVVFSPSAIGFDAAEFAGKAGGFLHTYREFLRSTGMKSGGEVIMRVATENSINPRLLVALLEYHSGWVTGQPETQADRDYPLGRVDLREQGLYKQLVWTVNQLSIGYYAYREGRLTEIQFSDGVKMRLAPDLNAGTAALQYYFAQLYRGQEWLDALNPEVGFPALYTSLLGNPWERARLVEPLFPSGLTQPLLTLPFGRNWTWAYTGGPHGAWEHDGAYAALDFAPGANESGCVKSNAWVVASAAGLVVRTGIGLVVLDLDGDGYEQTGWVLVYLHVATEDKIPLGAWVAAGDPLGHASCEGGFATGTHLHIARKYNGEWVPADGPLPFNLGGWIAHYGGLAYKGTLTRDGHTVTACTCSNAGSFITRRDEDP